jgi:single-strand DNA-binding protein
MADLNEIRLIGRLTKDPVSKTIPSGTQLATFGLATSHKYKDQTGVAKEDTVFVDITCWGKLAELASKYLKKGRQVFIGGRLRYETWEDKQAGQKRSKLTVVADNIQFLDAKKDEMPTSVPPEAYSAPSGGTHTYTEIQAAPEKDIVKDSSWGEPPQLDDQPPF